MKLDNHLRTKEISDSSRGSLSTDLLDLKRLKKHGFDGVRHLGYLKHEFIPSVSAVSRMIKAKM